MIKIFKKIFRKKQKGFTLIEIIVSIALISIVATTSTFAVIKLNNKKENDILKKYATKFDNALQVYLSNHNEIIDNVTTNAKGAIVTLDVLKNEGLIDSNLKIDYKKKYYFLSNAKLFKDTDTSCDTNEVELKSIQSWNVDTSDVIYVCTSNSSSSSISNYEQRISELESTIGILTSQMTNDVKIYNQNNPNNWVYFDVTSNVNDVAYWPNNDKKSKWRIYNYKMNSQNKIHPIKLVYSQPVLSDNNDIINLTYQSYSEDLYISTTDMANAQYRNNSKKIYYNKLSNCYKINTCSSSTYKCGDDYYVFSTNSNIYNNSTGKKVGNGLNVVSKISDLSTGVYCKFNNFRTDKYYQIESNTGFSYKDFESKYINSDGSYQNPSNLYKKYYLYNNINNKNFIKSSSYYSHYTVSGDLVFLNYSNSSNELLGVINKDEINTIVDKNSWISNLYANAYVGTGSYSFEDYIMYYNSSNGLIYGRQTVSKDSGSKYDVKAYSYVPAITLNEDVVVSGGTGTEEYPYILSLNGKTSH